MLENCPRTNQTVYKSSLISTLIELFIMQAYFEEKNQSATAQISLPMLEC